MGGKAQLKKSPCNNLNCDNSNYPKPEKLDLQGWDEHEWRGGAAALLSWLGHRRLCRSWLAFYPLPTRPWVHLLQVVIVNTCCRLLLFLPPLVRFSSSPRQNQPWVHLPQVFDIAFFIHFVKSAKKTHESLLTRRQSKHYFHARVKFWGKYP